jgi:hypothetical protein
MCTFRLGEPRGEHRPMAASTRPAPAATRPRSRTLALGLYVAGVAWLAGLGAGLALTVDGPHDGAAAPAHAGPFAVGDRVPLSFGTFVAHHITAVKPRANVPGHHYAPRGRTLVGTAVTVTNREDRAVLFPFARLRLDAVDTAGRRERLSPATTTARDAVIPARSSVTVEIAYLPRARSTMALRVIDPVHPAAPLAIEAAGRTGKGAPAVHVVRRDAGGGH